MDSRSIADSMDIDIDGDFDFREEAGEGDSAKRKASTKSKGVGASNQRGKTIAPAATARKVNTSAKAVTKSKGKKRAGQSDSSVGASLDHFTRLIIRRSPLKTSHPPRSRQTRTRRSRYLPKRAALLSWSKI